MHFPLDLPPDFIARASAVGLHPDDVAENFILGSGHGGQRRNKRATAVQLVHHPSATEIRCFHKREQHQNRIAAWMQLLEKLEEWKEGVEQAFKREEHAERQRTRPRSRGLKNEILKDKKQRTEIKRGRRKV